MSTCTSMPATREWRSRTTTSCSGTCPRPTRRAWPRPSRMLTRKYVLQTGGGFLLPRSLPPRLAAAAETVEISMRGNTDGSKVWFDPIGVLVQPGQTIRSTNRDPGNAHTTTAYHPKNTEHARRIPEGAEPWHSDYLLPNESASVTLATEGVYDYFCIPHEHAGMVRRVVVGHPEAADPQAFG